MNIQQPCPYCSSGNEHQRCVFSDQTPRGSTEQVYVCNECNRTYNVWINPDSSVIIGLLPSQMRPLD